MVRPAPGPALVGLGVVLAGVSVGTGGLSTGYGTGTTAVLLRVGIGYVVLGVGLGLVGVPDLRAAAGIAAAGLLAIFAAGSAVMYYDLAVTPPAFGTPLTTERLVANQAVMALGLAPVPAGVVAGAIVADDRAVAAVGALAGTAVVGWLAATGLMLARGASGLAGTVALLVIVAAVVSGLVPMILLGYVEAGASHRPDTR